MPINTWMCGLASGLVILSAQAQPQKADMEQVKLSQCLAAKISATYQTLAENKQYKVISIESAALENLARLADQAHCGRFVNLSQHFVNEKPGRYTLRAQSLLAPKAALSPIAVANVKYEIKHQPEVEALLSEVKPDNIWQTLSHLTSYENRSATTSTGVEAANWLKAQFEQMAAEAGRKDTATYFVDTGWYYKQPSLVTVIGKDIKAPAVVLGAHMDTLSGHMPGAGDDGSGSASIMEVARILLSSDLTLKSPVYIIWYAAEERGLVGSQYVVQDFLKKSIPVKAVMQFDMTGYRVKADDPTMWVFKDYTDPGLSNFVASLISNYVKVPVSYSRCGYGCSDHASWNEKGIPAAFPCESNFEEHNPYIHSSADTMSLLTLEHMANFTKLALAYSVELALD